MAIKLYLGLPGSGKSACAVREMFLDRTQRQKFSNIITKNIPQNTLITPSMLIKKNVIEPKSGRGKARIVLKCNAEYWMEQRKKYQAMDIIIDEAHTMFNARRSMSKINSVMTDFLALVRRMIGSNDSGSGELILITQLDRRIDVIARESATNVRWHVCHYIKKCSQCGFQKKENNETPEPLWTCPKCGWSLKKDNHCIEVRHFRNMQQFNLWKEMGMRTYHRHYYVTDIDKYFPMYDTLQMSHLLTEDFDEE